MPLKRPADSLSPVSNWLKLATRSCPCLDSDDSDFESNSSFCLQLITIAGTIIRIDVPVSIRHTWEMLEAYLVEHLPVVSHLDTFGCELTLLDVDTHQALQDPIQEDLWWNTQFHSSSRVLSAI